MNMANNEPQPCPKIITRFISEITQDWLSCPNQHGIFEIRCLGENRTTINHRFALDASDEATDLAVQMNKTKLNVYMTINPIDSNALIKAGSGAKDTDIMRAHYSFADADDQAGLTGIIKLSELCEPDIVVITGTAPHERRHAYWRLSEPCADLQLWRSKQSKIATLFATDGSVINASRVMRLAGTVSYPNTKKQTRGYVPELVTMTKRLN
jgi:hypothetical protein